MFIQHLRSAWRWARVIVGAVAVSRVLSRFLFATPGVDPAVIALVAAVLAVAATLACTIPVRRALTIDPVAALRES